MKAMWQPVSSLSSTAGLEQDARQRGVVGVGEGVGGQEGVDAEALGPHGLQLSEALGELGGG